MALLSTSYQPGSVTTATPGGYEYGGGGGMGGGGGDLGGIARLLEQRQREKEAKRETQIQALTPQAPVAQEKVLDMHAQQRRGLEESRADADYNATPASFGRRMMNASGGWGTFVDAADIPTRLQGKVHGGFYGDATNWDSSNPSIMGPQDERSYAPIGGSLGGLGIGAGGENVRTGPDGQPLPAKDQRADWGGMGTTPRAKG